MPLAPGDRLGRYRVDALLGKGGMGEVYRATDTELGRAVALKVIADKPDDEAIARFRREARTASALHHPNVATVFDVGMHEGSPYLVMELLDGEPLRRYVGDAFTPLSRRLEWLVDLAKALEAAHAEGLVHRDVKPDNVIVTKAGVAKLVDFGIARAAPAALDPSAPTVPGASTALTQTGSVIGSPAYMAPEQLRGEGADARSDQFAWGVTAFELITGELPWANATSTFAMAAKMLNEDARDITSFGAAADLPPATAAAVMRALSREPGERHESMTALRAAMGGDATGPRDPAPSGRGAVSPVASGSGAVEGKTGATTAAVPSRRPWPVLIGAVLVIGFGIWMLRGILEGTRAPAPPTKPGEPILGLSDKVTRERNEALHTPQPKGTPAASASAPASAAASPIRRCADETEGCPDENWGWCTADGKRVACCARGLVGNEAGRCVCAPGGTIDDKLIEGGCSRGEKEQGPPVQKVVREHFPELKACYEKALAQNPRISGKVSLAFQVAPDGTVYDAGLAGTSVPDPAFQDCLIEVTKTLVFPPPRDGHVKVTYPIDFAPG